MVYDSLFASLTRAASLMTPLGDALRRGRIRCTGWTGQSAAAQAAQWVKLANSLHARAAMRISQVDATKAKAELAKALAGPVLASNADNAFVPWPGGVLANPLCLNWAEAHGCGGTRDDQRISSGSWTRSRSRRIRGWRSTPSRRCIEEGRSDGVRHHLSRLPERHTKRQGRRPKNPCDAAGKNDRLLATTRVPRSASVRLARRATS